MSNGPELYRLLPPNSTSLAGSHIGDRPLFPARPRPTVVTTASGTWEQGTRMADTEHRPLCAEHFALIRLGIDLGIKQGVLIQNDKGLLERVKNKKLIVAAATFAKLLWGAPRPEMKMNSHGSYSRNILRLWAEIGQGAIGFTPYGPDGKPMQGHRYRIAICAAAIDEGTERVILEYPDEFLTAFANPEFVMLAPSTQLLEIPNDNARCIIPWIHTRLNSPTEELPDIFTVDELLVACGQTEEELRDLPPSRKWRLLNGQSENFDFISCLNGAELTTGERLRATSETDYTWDGQKKRFIALWVENPRNPFAKVVRQAEFIRQIWLNSNGSEDSYNAFMRSLDPETQLTTRESDLLPVLGLVKDSDRDNQRGVKAIYRRLGQNYHEMLKSVLESRKAQNKGAIITARLKEIISVHAAGADAIKSKLSQPALPLGGEDEDFIVLDVP